MIKLVGLSVVAAVCSLLLSELGFRVKKLFSVIALLCVLGVAIGEAGKLFGSVLGFCDTAGIGDAARAALKIIGVGYLFGIASEIVSELGEAMVAKGLILAGRVEILIIVLPYFVDIMKLGATLIE